MKSIQMTALILWMVIFIAAAFILGQFLASKGTFDVTSILTGERDNAESTELMTDEQLENDVVINKIGQETVRIGLNVAEDYFSKYYEVYINYIMSDLDKYPINEKITINDTLASDYVFYVVSRNIDDDKYESDEEDDNINISEAEINSFVDKMFGKEIDEAFKKDGKHGYNKTEKKYSIEKNSDYEEYYQELEKIENITSNELILTYTCKKIDEGSSNTKMENTLKLTCLYKGGRYIITEVQKED